MSIELNKKINSFADLNERERALLPSEQDILFYKESGWYASDIVIPEDLIASAIEGADAFYRGERDYKVANINEVANSQSEMVLRNNEFVTLQKKELRAVGFHPMISAIAATLCNTSEIRLFADSLLCKYPTKAQERGIVGWHTDKAYWPTCTSDKIITVWIPLQDCTIDMGPVTYIDGSHKWKNETALKSFYSFNNQNLLDFEDYLKQNKANHKRSAMTLKKGQVSFHNCHVIHCSLPNTSQKRRLALALHLQDASNVYQKVYKDNGEQIVIGYDKLCANDADGNPNYKDEQFFPLLFRAD